MLNATGTIVVDSVITVSAPSTTPTLCVNTSLTTPITHYTTGASGIGTPIGLPIGVTATWFNNTITISGIPSVSGTFNYAIPLSGGCGTVNATGTIIVNTNNSASAPSSTPTLCINSTLTPITHNTTGTSGIGSPIGLPTGVTAIWFNNTITISGTPTATGTFNYSIPLTGGCGQANATGTITVNSLPQPILTDGVICVDPLTGNPLQNHFFDTGLSASNHTFEWTYNDGNTTITLPHNGSTYSTNLVGTYTVVATNIQTNCMSSPVSAVVTSSQVASGIIATVNEAFAQNSMITVSVVGGSGPYLYQLNDGEFQVSNVFENVSGGTHIVRVIDILGCTFLSTTVTVIKYMLFFTPNGDGYNDRWKINGLNQNDAKINIFDRYGKLIKEMTGINSNSGWDGTYNGDVLPASDYWFTIDFIENDVQRTFKAHFSLKR